MRGRKMSDKKERIVHLNSTVCYLKKDDKILMINLIKNGGKYMHHQEENLKQANLH